MEFEVIKKRLNERLGAAETYDERPEDDLGFVRVRRYRPEEVAAWEEKWGISLPADYRGFLCEVGAALLFGGGGDGAFPTGLFIYPLELMFSRVAEAFAEPEKWLGKRLIVVGVDRYRQDMVVMRLNGGVGGAVAPVSHEYAGEEWLETADELKLWVSFSEYVSSIADEKRS